jgi:preprotein translocase subunit YajC
VPFLFILILLVLFWVVIVVPQRRKQRAHAAMQDSVVVGDEIITAGGLHGEVVTIAGEVVRVEIAPNVVVRLDRRAIAAVARDLGEEEEDEEPDELEDEEDGAPVLEEHPGLEERSAAPGRDAQAR